MGHLIGIDLGTTYSAVSVFNPREGRYVIIPSRRTTPTTPSVVAFSKGEVIVGDNAKSRMILDPDNAVAEIKRHMGEPKRDAAGNEMKDGEGKPVPFVVDFAGKPHTPQMISAYILQELKAIAEDYLGGPVTGAVITVPAYFKSGPRRATEEAGALAGLDVKCLLNEPTAAAISFGLTGAAAEDEDEDEERARKVLVYDLGGGTFDVSIIEIRSSNVEVLAVEGDHHLGGVDFDKTIVGWLLAKIKGEFGVDLSQQKGLKADKAKEYRRAIAELDAEAENAKVALSSQKSVDITLPRLFQTDSGEMANIDETLSRNEFLMLIGTKLKETIATVDRALASAKLDKKDIDDVLLVGGSSKIPKIRDLLEKHFGKPPRGDINPDECVAQGASMRALSYVDVEELSADEGAVVEEQREASPEIIDITGHSLGVREGANNMSVLLPKNTMIPAIAEEIYGTSADFATTVKVVVYQGEDPVADRNTLLTEFDVNDLPSLPRGHAKIKIRFELDINGVLAVTVTDLVAGKELHVTTSYGGAEPVDAKELANLRGSAPAPETGRGGGGPAASAIPENLKATWDRAQQILAKLSGADHAKLKGHMDAVEAAVATRDAGKVEEAGNELMDVLFDFMI